MNDRDKRITHKNVAFRKNMAPPLEVPYSFLRYLPLLTQVLNRAAA